MKASLPSRSHGDFRHPVRGVCVLMTLPNEFAPEDTVSRGGQHLRFWRDPDVCPLCQSISDIHRQGVVNLDPEITDRALDLGVIE